jgi:hypothetical protein
MKKEAQWPNIVLQITDWRQITYLQRDQQGLAHAYGTKADIGRTGELPIDQGSKAINHRIAR